MHDIINAFYVNRLQKMSPQKVYHTHKCMLEIGIRIQEPVTSQIEWRYHLLYRTKMAPFLLYFDTANIW